MHLEDLSRSLQAPGRLFLLATLSLLGIGVVAGSAVTSTPLLAVAIVPLGLILVRVLRRPTEALLLFLVQVPFTCPLVDAFFPAKLQGGRGFLIILFLSFGHAWVFRRTARRRLVRIDGLALAFLTISFLSLFRAVIGFSQSFDLYFASTLVPLFVYLVIRSLPMRAVDVDLLLDMLAVVAVLIAALLCVERVTHFNFFNPSNTLAGWNEYASDATYRVSGPFVNPNNAGAFVVIGMAFLGRHATGARRTLVRITWAMMAVAVFLTISRAAYLAVAIVFLFAQLHRGRLNRILLLGVFGAVGAAMLLPFLLANETVSEGVMNSSSMVYRLTLLGTAWSMLSSGGWELVFGFGYENFRYLASDFAPEAFAAVPAVRGAGMPLHNDFLAILIHYGVVGLAVFLGLIWKLLSRAWQLRARALAAGDSRGANRAVAICCIVLVQMVMSTAHVPFATYQLATMFWFAAAVLAHQKQAFLPASGRQSIGSGTGG